MLHTALLGRLISPRKVPSAVFSAARGPVEHGAHVVDRERAGAPIPGYVAWWVCGEGKERTARHLRTTCGYEGRHFILGQRPRRSGPVMANTGDPDPDGGRKANTDPQHDPRCAPCHDWRSFRLSFPGMDNEGIGGLNRRGAVERRDGSEWRKIRYSFIRCIF